MLGILEKKVTVSIIYVVDWYKRTENCTTENCTTENCTTENCTTENCPMINHFWDGAKTGVYKKNFQKKIVTTAYGALSLIFSFNIY